MIYYRGNPHCAHENDAPGSPAVIRAKALDVRYPDMRVPALTDIHCEIPQGTHTALVGPNGAGKSTFLKATAGLLKPTGGSLTVYDCPAHHCHPYTSYLPQRSQLDWNFPTTLKDLVLTGSYVHLGWFRRPGRREKDAADRALRQLRLHDLADRRIGQLSGGQQQRALLARALVHGAQLYLLDEPFSGIDSETVGIMSEVLNGVVQEEGKTVVTSLHAWEDLPLHIHRVMRLDAGNLVECIETKPPE